MGKASSLFHSDREHTLHKRITPSPEQRDFLQLQWNALSEYLKTILYDKYGYPISTWLQGSYKYGTLIRPVNKSEEYDVDVGVYFSWESDGTAEPSPEQLRDWVQSALLNYSQKNSDIVSISIPPKTRCSRAVYAKQFHIDTPVYHLEPITDKRRLATLPKSWEASDPKSFYKWFRDVATGANRDQLRRLIRYLKAWAAVSFTSAENSRPSSILLTVLAVKAYNDEVSWLLLPLEDDDILTKVIQRIHSRLVENPEVLNPSTTQRENLNRIAPEYWDGFLSRLRVLLDCAEDASAATDEAAAALAWGEAFSFLMPLPNAQEVEIARSEDAKSLMQVPDIKISVYRQNPRELIAHHRNEVPNVAKGCDLVFTIENPHIIPEFATIEWTVRNTSSESDDVGDLGHRRVGIHMFTAEEVTKYAGLHYMDCVVRVSGAVYAVRRIPVHIKDIKYPPRNPPLPFYKKIRSIRKKR